MKIKAYAIIDKEYQKEQFSDFYHADPITKFAYMPSEANYETTDYILSKTLEEAQEKADFITSNTAREIEVKEVEINIK
jgi:hypothetical protein